MDEGDAYNDRFESDDTRPLAPTPLIRMVEANVGKECQIIHLTDI